MGTFVGGDFEGGNFTNLNSSITWPATEAGDLAIFLWTHSATATEVTQPAGFTLFDTDTDGSCVNVVYTKVCTGSESGNVAVGLSGASRQVGVLFVVRGYTGIDVAAHTARAASSTTQNPPSVTPSVADGAAVTIAAERLTTGTTTATPPTGFDSNKVEFGTSGSGGVYCGIAWDGGSVSRSAGVAVDPGNWTGFTSGSDGIARTLILTPEGAPSATGVATGSVSWAGRAGKDLIAAVTPPVYLAHRGGALEAPENTITAFDLSFALHPSVIGESDLRVNQSGSGVLMHDATVDRTAGAGETGDVATYTDAEWADLTVAWPIPPGGTAVPAAFWSDARDQYTDRIFVPEAITNSAVTLLVDELATRPSLTWRVLGQAFNKTNAATLAAAGYRTVQLYSSSATIDLAADAAAGMWAVSIDKTHADLDSTLITSAHGLGLLVFVWTVNTTGERDTWLAAGADGIVTDRPSLLVPSDAPNEGTATGTVAWAGSAAGERVSEGTATGSVAWTAAATGERASEGAASGGVLWTTAASGERGSQGSASGSVAWTGYASSSTRPQGFASGTVAWTGSAAGVKHPRGSAVAGTVWTGSATGARTSSGTAAGAVVWTGSGSSAEQRDVDVILGDLHARLSTSAISGRLTTQQPAQRLHVSAIRRTP